MHRTILFGTTLLVLLASGCCFGDPTASSGDRGQSLAEQATVPTAPSEPAAAPTPPADHVPIAIPSLGLRITMPPGSEVLELLGKQWIQGGNVQVQVWRAGPEDPETIAQALESVSARRDPANVVQQSLEDGWLLTYHAGGGHGARFIHGRRVIGGTAYMCGETAYLSDEEQTAAAIACRSLQPSE